MRWIKHPSSFCRSAAMTDVRESLGPAGYGAAWLLLERIGESWSGKNAPELRISVKEWSKTCGLSVKKLQDLLKIMENHEIVFSKDDDNKLQLTAPILLELQDEWTSRTRKNSGVTPEPVGSHSGIEQNRIHIEKNRDKHSPTPAGRPALFAVLHRHGVTPGSERATRIVRHIEARAPHNPGGYLESILQRKPDFDPTGDVGEEEASEREALCSAGDILCGLGMSQTTER